MTHGSNARKRAAAPRRALAIAALLSCLPAHAFLLEGEALDTAANVLALIVIVVVPIAAVVVFWMLHVLPEKIAHKRQHPQRDAIKMMCLLSLAFGGLLWPLAWLWAYSKPVLYKIAYGADTLEHDAVPRSPEAAVRPAALARVGVQPAGVPNGGELAVDRGALTAEITRVRTSIDRMLTNGGAPKELAVIRDQLAALESPLSKANVEELH